MSSDVIDINAKSEKVDDDYIPEATKNALADPGWIGAALYVSEIGSSVFGNAAVISTIPDPEGWHQQQTGKANTMPGIFCEISSVMVPGLVATLVVPYEVDAYGDIRRVMADLFVKLREAEMHKMNEHVGGLLVPERRIVLPGEE